MSFPDFFSVWNCNVGRRFCCVMHTFCFAALKWVVKQMVNNMNPGFKSLVEETLATHLGAY